MKPRILFVSDVFNADLRQSQHGVYKRMRMFLEALARIGSLDVLFYVPDSMSITPEAIEAYQADILRLWRLRVSLQLCRLGPPAKPNVVINECFIRGPFGHRTGGLAQVAALRKMIATNPHCIVIHRLNCAHTLLQLGRVDPPVFFDLDDVEHLAFLRALREPPHWKSKPIQYLQLPAIVNLERRIAAVAKATFVCSETDARHLRSVCRMPRVTVVPNAVELPHRPKVSPSKKILFVGTFRYEPNIHAADYLVAEIWPIVRAAVPDATLELIGMCPENTQSYHRTPAGVRFKGFVPDLAKEYEGASLVCCPIRSGSGTRIKIIEAAAYEVPVVATTFGAQGLAFEHDKQILLQDDTKSIAAACVTLLSDPAFGRRLAHSARATVERLYDREFVIDSIRTRIESEIMESHRQHPE